MPAFIVLLLSLFICSCTETRTDTQAQTNKQDDITASGSIALPAADGRVLPLPFTFTLTRNGSEDQTAHTDSKTKIDTQAIVQQIGGVVGPLIDAAISKAAGINTQQSKAWSGFTATETTAGGGALTAAMFALQQMLAKRSEAQAARERLEREQKALEEVKRARNEAQAQALELAKQVPPATA